MVTNVDKKSVVRRIYGLCTYLYGMYGFIRLTTTRVHYGDSFAKALYSGNRDHSKHPFRMIANANIDKLMINFYHCPYSRTSTVLTRTNTCTGQKFDWTLPPASRGTLHLFLFSFPVSFKKLAMENRGVRMRLFDDPMQERRFFINRMDPCDAARDGIGGTKGILPNSLEFHGQ